MVKISPLHGAKTFVFTTSFEASKNGGDPRSIRGGSIFLTRRLVNITNHVQFFNWYRRQSRQWVPQLFEESFWEFILNEISSRIPLKCLNNTIYTGRRIAWFWFWWRTWQAAISLGELHASFEPKISECAERRNHAGNWNILVPAGKENKKVYFRVVFFGKRRKKIKMIPLLAESEKGKGQAESLLSNKLGDVVWMEFLSCDSKSSGKMRLRGW